MVVIRSPVESVNSQVTHSFAISSHEVTVAEFRRFQQQQGIDPGVALAGDNPIANVSWYMAAEYCNWLSHQQGIPDDQWVYEPNDSGQFNEGMRIRNNFLDLEGYRLPTDTEWDQACRAETIANHSFGEPESSLHRYCRYALNSSGRSPRWNRCYQMLTLMNPSWSTE